MIYLLDLQEITPDNLLPEIKSLLGDEVGNIAKLAIVVLVEQKLGQVILFFLFYALYESLYLYWWVVVRILHLLAYFRINFCLSCCIAIFSLYEEFNGFFYYLFLYLQKSEWAPYISRLPQHGEMHNTVSDSFVLVAS